MKKFTDFVNLVKYSFSGLDGESVKHDLVEGYCYYKSTDPLTADIQNLIYTLAKISSNDFEVVLNSDVESFSLEDCFCQLLVELSDPEALQNFDFELIADLANKFLAYILSDYTLDEIENDLLSF